MRRFWATHALTTDTVGGLLLLGLTVLVVNQVVSRRQLAARSRVMAAQAGFLVGQARRTVMAVRSLQNGKGDHDAASEENRTYQLMLMVGAPVLIDSPIALAFLDQAQRLAGELARILVPDTMSRFPGGYAGGLDEAIEHLRDAAVPLLTVLTSAERSLVESEEGGGQEGP